jgi:hypothetical protein
MVCAFLHDLGGTPLASRNAMPKNDQDTNWGNLAMVGIEVGIGVGLGYFVGRWLDNKYGWGSRGAITGAMLGLAGGLYLLIKQAIQANKD